MLATTLEVRFFILNFETKLLWVEDDVKLANESEDEDQEPSFQYPVDIVYETEDGDLTVTINNDGELESAYAECYGDE